jgi:hypothetical protein
LKDLFGFPRRSEAVGVGALQGASWKVFWSTSFWTTGGVATRLSADKPFPSRYFKSASSLMPTSNAATTRVDNGMFTPVIRYQFMVAIGVPTVSFQVALSSDFTTVTTLNSVTPTANVGFGWGYLFPSNPTSMASINMSLTDAAAPAGTPTLVSFTYGQQDLWFTLSSTAAVTGYGPCIVEYLDYPAA